MTRGILFLAVVAVSVDAHADDGQTTGEAAVTVERSSHRFAVSASVLRPVAARMGELGAELRIGDKMAASTTLGFGPGRVVNQTMSGGFESEDVLCAAGTAMFRYYALGDFDRGLFVGGETVYFYMDRDRDNSVSPEHEGLWIGPTVGYKYTFDFGLTLGANISAFLPLYRTDGIDEDQVPGGVEDDHPFVGPVMLGPNAVVGWSL